MQQHPFDIVHYVVVRHPHKPEAVGAKQIGSPLIVRQLIGMRVTVHLDNQPGLGTEEVSDERSQPDLAAELISIELAAAEALPQALFGWS